MPIHGIFYARFLPQEGTKIVAQSPPGCIVPVAVADENEEENDGDFDTAASIRRDSSVLETACADGPDSQIGPRDEDSLGSDIDDRDSDGDDNNDDIDADDEDTTTKPIAATATANATATPSNLYGGSNTRTHSKSKRHTSRTYMPKRARGRPLFNFDVMSEYVIPRPAFFNRYIAAQDPSGRYTVLGLPVAIRDAKYDRNEFIFNFGIVVDADTDQGPYERVVRRLASTFAEMEKQNEFLSREELKSTQTQRGKTTGKVGDRGIGETLHAEGLGQDLSSCDSTNTRPTSLYDAFKLTETPGVHAMAGGTGNSTSGSHTDGHLDRRQPAVPQSPQLSPRRREEHQQLPSETGSKTLPARDANSHSPYHRRSIQTLLEIIKEDLNLYGECMIPVDDANTINMKLFPLHPNPPAVEGWHVPVPKMRLAGAIDPSWDLTLQRVIAHMDGVSDVRRIAFEADISIELCRSALRHLLYYDTILLLDMFFFGSCYAPRPGIHDFVANVDGIVDECARYVCLQQQFQDEDSEDEKSESTLAGSAAAGPKTRPGSSSSTEKRGQTRLKPKSVAFLSGGASDDDSDGEENNKDNCEGVETSYPRKQRAGRVSNYDLIRLMTSFCVGRTVTEWLKGHASAGFDVLRYVDVRRFVQFGIIKGCLYRVHKYVVSKQYLTSLVTGQSAVARPVAASSHENGHDGESMAHASNVGKDPLQKYTDGHHNFDQIMTEQNLTERELIERLKILSHDPSDLKILYR